MKTIILAGGYGSRLSEETATIPKPLVEVAGRPLIWHIMRHYASYGFNDFIVACGYKADKIKEYFLNLSLTSNDFTVDIAQNKTSILADKRPNWMVTLVDTGLGTATGGRIKKIEETGILNDDDTFMMTYGDGVSDVNIEKLERFHQSHKKKATLTAVPMPRFGMLEMKDAKVVSFKEKRLHDAPLISGGFFVLNKSVLDYIEDYKTPFETTPLEGLAKDDELRAFKHMGYWRCCDTLKDKQLMEEELHNMELDASSVKG